jgi:hypothetical protein
MRRSIALAIPVLLVLLINPAVAGELPEWRTWPTGDRVSLAVGAYNADLSTTIRVDGPVVGTTLSFERDLGMKDNDTRPIVTGYWKFLKRHALTASYFDLDRSGGSTSTVEISIKFPDGIDFGDIHFSVDLPIQAFFDVKIFNLGYSYSLLFSPKQEWKIGLALSFQDFKLGLQGKVLDDPTFREDVDALAPLPTFTTSYSYAITDKWMVDLAAGYFTIEFDLGNGKFDGSVLNLNTAIRYKAFKHLGFGLAYNWFDVDIDISENDDLNGHVDYRYKGPTLFVQTYF